MRTFAKRVVVQIVGWVFILVGIVGLFLPILQGVLFLLIGLMILSTEYAWAHHLLSKIRQRYPKLSDKVDQAAQKASQWLRRMAGQNEADSSLLLCAGLQLIEPCVPRSIPRHRLNAVGNFQRFG